MAIDQKYQKRVPHPNDGHAFVLEKTNPATENNA
jgi:hypothetical protein